MTQLLSYAYFEVIDARSAAAQERLGRHYLLILQSQPAWGVYQVTVQRGGAGREIEPLGYPCATYDAMLADARTKIMRRFNHGYTMVAWQADFPLLAWIRDHQYPIHAQTPARPFALQLALPLKIA